MHTDGDELIPSVNDWPAEAVFMGSGLTAARRPGMTGYFMIFVQIPSGGRLHRPAKQGCRQAAWSRRTGIFPVLCRSGDKTKLRVMPFPRQERALAP